MCFPDPHRTILVSVLPLLPPATSPWYSMGMLWKHYWAILWKHYGDTMEIRAASWEYVGCTSQPPPARPKAFIVFMAAAFIVVFEA